MHPITRLHIVTVGIKRKRAVSRVVFLVSLFVWRQGKKTVTGKAQIGILPCRLHTTIGKQEIDTGNSRTQPDLLRIRTADLPVNGTRRPRQRLADHVGKRHPTGLKAGGVDVGNIVADDVHTRLMIF